MPKRDRDSDKEEEVTVKVEPGTAPDADAPEDLREAKEMLKTALDQAAQLAAEKADAEAKKAETEAKFAAFEAQRTIERVHAVFKLNENGEGRMPSAHLIRNPNLLNIIENSGTDLSWTQDHRSPWNNKQPGYTWWYVPVDSWSKVPRYFEKGPAPLDLDVQCYPKFDAVANIIAVRDDASGITLIVGALTYRCTDKFRHHLYEEKYKKETERLWPEEKESFLGRDLKLEGGFSVPTSLNPAIAAEPFDATIENVFLPTDDSRTAGAHFDLNMDKMVAIKKSSDEKMPLFTAYANYRSDKASYQK